jgi:nitroimidazol reductase NimA-like FMN-containing flavoprotein (pyridoxamine 5'-phosphate oxidase superfamily)
VKGIRRKEKEIRDKTEIIRILDQAKYVTVAMIDVDGPYLVTLTHAYDRTRNAIYFHCARDGKKVDILKRDGRVWGQALTDLGYVPGKCDHLYETAQFRGKVTFVDQPAEKRRALEILIRKNEERPEQVIRKQLTDESVSHVNIGRIDIDYMSGKRSDKVIVSM